MDSFDKIYFNSSDLTQFQIMGNCDDAGGGYRSFSSDSPFVINFTGTFNVISNTNLIDIISGVPTLNAANYLEAQRQIKLTEIQNSYQLAENAGYADATTGITLGWDDNSRNMFNQLLTMLMIAQSAGIDPGDQTFSDLQNVTHTLSVSDTFALMLRYGAAYQTLWGKLGTLRSSIVQATTLDQLNAITWS